MSQEQWSAVDAYFVEKLGPTDPVLQAVLSASDAAELPPIAVAPNQGKLLQLLVQMTGAKRVLEIGTLAAYSTILMARAVGTHGKVVTLEAIPHHAEVAQKNVAHAGLTDIVDIRVGDAQEALAQLVREGVAPFDFVFIDADKVNNPHYLEWARKLSRPGTVIVCDNVVRDGAVIDATNTDPSVIGTRRFFDMLASN
ncbi:MAG: O-methyltransferase, partial [Brachymonas sp.]|nr:O-methyltransferase [Brachymonas sp.]